MQHWIVNSSGHVPPQIDHGSFVNRSGSQNPVVKVYSSTRAEASFRLDFSADRSQVDRQGICLALRRVRFAMISIPETCQSFIVSFPVLVSTGSRNFRSSSPSLQGGVADSLSLLSVEVSWVLVSRKDRKTCNAERGFGRIVSSVTVSLARISSCRSGLP